MNATGLLRALGDAGVEYVLVGGLAVQLHGYQRSTFDIDLVLAMNDQNLSRFIDAARTLSLTPVIPVSIDSLRDAAQIDRWHREKGMLAFALREPQAGGSTVDVLVRPEVPYAELSERALKATLFGREVRIAGLDDLLVMKRAAGRPKDLLDIVALEKIQRGEDPNA